MYWRVESAASPATAHSSNKTQLIIYIWNFVTFRLCLDPDSLLGNVDSQSR